MIYLVDSTYVVVMIIIGLIVFVLVAYLIVRMFAQNSKKDYEMESFSGSES